VAEPTQASSGPVVVNPMMPYWPVPPPMAGPATGVNMGMDYWGAPTSVAVHGKAVAAPTSAPSSNSRDIVLSDPAIQVCYYSNFGSRSYFSLGPCLLPFFC
jgi:plant G-box-binding factor